MIELLLLKLQDKNAFEQPLKPLEIGIIIISVCISLFASYCSLACNISLGTTIPYTILYAIIAFILGPLYSAYYYLFGERACRDAIMLADIDADPSQIEIPAAP